MRFGAFDLIPSGAEEGPTSAVIATWSGDAWRVDGLDEDLDELTWQRVATGLNQPFGVLCEEGSTLVLGRDQITKLVDSSGDGEADLHACLSNAPRNSEHFHEPASGLLRGPDGRLHWIKAARHAKRALHDQHGAIVRLRPDGEGTEVIARGLRAPIGLTMLPDGALLCSDQEGHWTPANRINLVRPDAASPPFLGNGWAAQSGPVARRREGREAVQVPWPADAEMVSPLCWIHPSVDRSPSSQVLADHPAWGPLQGRILGLSYGTGEVYLVLREDVSMKLTAFGSVVGSKEAESYGLSVHKTLDDAIKAYELENTGESEDEANALARQASKPTRSASRRRSFASAGSCPARLPTEGSRAMRGRSDATALGHGALHALASAPVRGGAAQSTTGPRGPWCACRRGCVDGVRRGAGTRCGLPPRCVDAGPAATALDWLSAGV